MSVSNPHLRRHWLQAYLLASAGDWLQGPYLYSVYRRRGLADGQITALAALGFLASAVLGAPAAALADTRGRWLLALLATLAYATSCVLLLLGGSSLLWLGAGKLASGIATALLSPVFEAWLIGEHGRHDRPLLALCGIQACFESAMFTFVFFWAPLLQQRTDGAVPFGIVFAAFMGAYASGPILYRRWTASSPHAHDVPSAYALFLASAATSLLSATFLHTPWAVGISLAMFELHCGMHTLWSAQWRVVHIPEQARGIAAGIVAASMNTTVTAILLFLGDYPRVGLGLAAALLLAATLLARTLPQKKHRSDCTSPETDIHAKKD
ncbi:hypothetical protein THASP1DRAFT_30023 [Thamnocephalis sphaerospora]|uniref:Molybdate-anion transporter n=1 Tax=Thamnocephalis sphaerospora TaxID=78915 RepID=A0A4P9XQ81_9FUNG|nr:hypothetical protein THASP1DRAFT_30023 [Thamnocephalis sphaerospora]|eukprot:RKP08178.1 hypothetical protein THASP1DRAFT_30023 [Thamnocephalis sphaerospora]